MNEEAAKKRARAVSNRDTERGISLITCVALTIDSKEDAEGSPIPLVDFFT